MKQYKFIKSGMDWYIDLPEFLEQGGSIGDLQMVDGADKMLDIVAAGKDSTLLSISTESFPKADVLILKEKCDPLIGGGNYYLAEFEGENVNQNMWLCQVTEFVFGDIPPKIYIRKEN